MTVSSFEEQLRSLAVLVVDDHDVNREFLRAGLSGSIGRLDLVDSGQAAIDHCRIQVYDVILMDLHMPQMDGVTAANRIRDLDSPSARARIVILTADARAEERARLLAQGFDAFLNKPLSIADLKSALWRLFEPASNLAQPRQDYSAGEQPLIAPPLARAAAHGDAQMATRLGLMLSQELQEKLPLFEQLLQQGRLHEASVLLHQWTGAAGFAGAVRLSQACSRLHRLLLQTEAGSTGSACTRFLRTAHATRRALALGLTRDGSN